MKNALHIVRRQIKKKKVCSSVGRTLPASVGDLVRVLFSQYLAMLSSIPQDVLASSRTLRWLVGLLPKSPVGIVIDP